MYFDDILINRRSIRFYKPDKIEPEKIEQILQNAVKSPTARNAQPWAFKVIDDEKVINDISDCAKEYMLATLAGDPAFMTYKERFEDAGYSLFHHAPLLFVVYATNNSTSAMMDCSMAAYTAMLTATNIGLGSCWIGLSTPYLMTDMAREKFNLPSAEYTPVAPLAMGYAKYPVNKIPVAEKNPPIIL